MLKVTLKDKIIDYIRNNKELQYLGFGNDFRVKFLAQGEYNINFTIYCGEKKYVFRVNTGSQIDVKSQIRYEFEALKRLEISGVTPKVFFVDDTKTYFNYGILIMEFLDGRPLEYNKDLNKAAHIFSRIHSLDLNKIDTSNFIVEENIFTDRVNEGKKLLKDFLVEPKVNKDTKKFFYRFLEWAEENKWKEEYFTNYKWHVINNTEVNSHNFIIGDKKSYLIDWEKPVLSDPCQDLTQFLAPTTTLWKADYILSVEEKEQFFKEYIKGLGGIDNDIRDRVRLYMPYLYLRALSWCAFAYLEYQKPDKDIKNMDTFKKIKAYLDIDFMRTLLKEYISDI